MKNLKNIFALIIASVVILSCEKNEAIVDTIKPSVTISEPHNEDQFAPGAELHFEAVFADNVALASYKIDIHFNADGHSHRPAYANEEDDHEAWDFEHTGKLSGPSHQIIEHFDIPKMVNGKPIEEGGYHLGVYTIDAAGNQSVVWRKIDITDGAEAHNHEH